MPGGGPNIVFVGHVTIDHNITENNRYESWGSPAMYMARFVQQEYKLAPIILTRRGRDFAQYEKGLQFIPHTPSLPHTLVYENTVRNKLRTQRSFHAQLATAPRLSSSARSVLSKADIVIVAPLLANYSATFVCKVLTATPSTCIKILSPQGYFRHVASDGAVSVRQFHTSEMRQIFQHFTAVVYSDEDYPDAISQSVEWSKAVPQTQLIVTQNARGATIIHNAAVTHIPTAAVPTNEIIDSVGCGDVFTMAFALHVWKQHALSQAVRAGHRAARKKLLSRR